MVTPSQEVPFVAPTGPVMPSPQPGQSGAVSSPTGFPTSTAPVLGGLELPSPQQTAQTASNPGNAPVVSHTEPAGSAIAPFIPTHVVQDIVNTVLVVGTWSFTESVIEGSTVYALETPSGEKVTLTAGGTARIGGTTLSLDDEHKAHVLGASPSTLPVATKTVQTGNISAYRSGVGGAILSGFGYTGHPSVFTGDAASHRAFKKKHLIFLSAWTATAIYLM